MTAWRSLGRSKYTCTYTFLQRHNHIHHHNHIIIYKQALGVMEPEESGGGAGGSDGA